MNIYRFLLWMSATSGPSLWVNWRSGVFVVIGVAAAVAVVVTKSCGFWSWTNGIWGTGSQLVWHNNGNNAYNIIDFVLESATPTSIFLKVLPAIFDLFRFGVFLEFFDLFFAGSRPTRPTVHVNLCTFPQCEHNFLAYFWWTQFEFIFTFDLYYSLKPD